MIACGSLTDPGTHTAEEQFLMALSIAHSIFLVHPDNAYLKQECTYWLFPVWCRRAAELVAE
jgi:hypothetical protein